MKKKFLFATLICLIFGFYSFAQSLNSNQQNLREGITAHLKSQGYSPKKLTDSKMSFIRDGHEYFLFIDATKLTPMKVSISTTKPLPEGLSQNNVIHATVDKSTSVRYSYMQGNNRYTMSCGIYLQSVEDFKIVLQSWLEEFDSATNAIKSELPSQSLVTSSGESKPVATTGSISINKIEIANTHKNNTIIDLYGDKIYSDNAMYLKPRISYDGHKNGDLTLRVKWFDTEGKLMRANENVTPGYSQEDTYEVGTGDRSNILFLAGFGYDVKGKWKTGTYRVEIWDSEQCLKSHEFKLLSRIPEDPDDAKLVKIANRINEKYSKLPISIPVYEGHASPSIVLNEIKVVNGMGINFLFKTNIPVDKLSVNDREAYIDACERYLNEVTEDIINQTNNADLPLNIETEEMLFYCLDDPNDAHVAGAKM